MQGGWVYILTDKPNGTLHIGVTNDLSRGVEERRTGAVPGFASRYGLKRLVYAERHDDLVCDKRDHDGSNSGGRRADAGSNDRRRRPDRLFPAVFP
jgi:hypothetical protein